MRDDRTNWIHLDVCVKWYQHIISLLWEIAFVLIILCAIRSQFHHAGVYILSILSSCASSNSPIPTCTCSITLTETSNTWWYHNVAIAWVCWGAGHSYKSCSTFNLCHCWLVIRFSTICHLILKSINHLVLKSIFRSIQKLIFKLIFKSIYKSIFISICKSIFTLKCYSKTQFYPLEEGCHIRCDSIDPCGKTAVTYGSTVCAFVYSLVHARW